MQKNLKLKDFTLYSLPTPEWYRPAGVLLEVLAYVIFILGFYYVFPKVDLWILFVLIGAIALFTWNTGRRLQTNTRKNLSKDDREPILYLRPFSHEQQAKNYYNLGRLYNLFGNKSGAWVTDGAIARVLKDVGPLITVGMPRENLTPLGALRLYFSDEEWQENIKALMSISRLIIIQPGYTSNLEWEMNAARQVLRPEQLYISFLDWRGLSKAERQREFEIFKLQVERIYGVLLPEHLSNSYFVYFDNNWRPVGVTLDWPVKLLLFAGFSRNFQSFDMMLTPLVREILRPVLQKRGIKLSRLRTAVHIVATHSINGIFLYYFLYYFINFLFRAKLIIG